MDLSPDTPRKASILIVDDTPANLQLLARMLKEQGYEARPVPSGKLALQAARSNPPDLILLDVNMPEMNGFEMCGELKKDQQLSDIPVIFISGNNETFDKVKAFASGGVDYVTKPFQLEEIQARMESHLKIRRLQLELDRNNKQLQHRVQEQVQEISEAQKAVLEAKTEETLESGTKMNSSLAGAHRGVLISLRLLTLVLVSSFLVFKRPAVTFDTGAIVLLTFFLLSIVAMFFLFQSWLEKKYFVVSIFLLDTFFISYGLYLTGVEEWDLMAVYFLTIFICALARDMKTSVGVGIAACFVYLLLQYKATGQWLMADTLFLLKLPFLLIVATFSGYLAADSRAREEMTRRYGRINQAISEQADIATQKLKETGKHLSALVKYYNQILANIKTGIVVAHQNEKVGTFNQAACHLTGLDESMVMGSRLTELPSSFQPVADLMRRTLKEEKSFFQENVELRTSKSEPASVSLQTTLLQSPGGEILGVIATLKDISLVKQMELQLMRSERLATLGEMAAGVAHEIKNPLNAILGFSQRLAGKLEDEKLKKYAEIIVGEVKRMAVTINDVLEYNRYQKPAKELVDFNVALEDALIIVAEKAEASKVQIAREIDPGLPLIPMDKNNIKQVLLNLVFNAINAMETGGTLTVRARVEEGMLPADQAANPDMSLLQQVFLQQKMVSISIKDTGCGIPKENLQKLFNPFFTTKTTGTGLGLSICHKIVESHGGFMRVESQVGAGSNFIFYLPLEEGAKHEAK
jgi:two-component system, NtrC family, nitrogen regulation sensor histidine kinase GlnL